MLITFSSKSSGDILMLDKHAIKVLQAMGRSYEVMPEQGVITREQLQGSIMTLEEAIRQDHTAADTEKGDQDDLDLGLANVNLSRRAFPLLAMMKEAMKHDEDHVVWRSENAW